MELHIIVQNDFFSSIYDLFVSDCRFRIKNIDLVLRQGRYPFLYQFALLGVFFCSSSLKFYPPFLCRSWLWIRLRLGFRRRLNLILQRLDSRIGFAYPFRRSLLVRGIYRPKTYRYRIVKYPVLRDLAFRFTFPAFCPRTIVDSSRTGFDFLFQVAFLQCRVKVII